MPDAPPVQIDTLTRGNEKLHRVSISPAQAWAQLVVLHGYGDHSGRYRHFLKWMSMRGIGCQAIDFRGHGQSPGRRAYVQKWDEYLADLSVFLHAQDRAVPLFVLGHSHGALIAAAAAIDNKLDCTGCILSAPYFDLRLRLSRGKRLLAAVGTRICPALRIRSGIRGEMLTRDPEMAAETDADPLYGRFATPRWFVTTRKVQTQVRDRAPDFKLPLLMLIAGQDKIANPSASVRFYERAGSSDKTLKIYENHRHELLREMGREMIFEEIRKWMEERA